MLQVFKLHTFVKFCCRIILFLPYSNLHLSPRQVDQPYQAELSEKLETVICALSWSPLNTTVRWPIMLSGFSTDFKGLPSLAIVHPSPTALSTRSIFFYAAYLKRFQTVIWIVNYYLSNLKVDGGCFITTLKTEFLLLVPVCAGGATSAWVGLVSVPGKLIR